MKFEVFSDLKEVSIASLYDLDEASIKSLGEQLYKYGIVKIKHDIDSTLLNSFREVGFSLHKLPCQEKEKLTFCPYIGEYTNESRGYIAYEKLPESPIIDTDIETYVKHNMWVFSGGPLNLYPSEKLLPSARSIIRTSLNELRRTGNIIRDSLMIYFGDEQRRLEQITAAQFDQLHILSLESHKGIDPNSSKLDKYFLRLPSHKDVYTLFKLLLSNPIGGLQIKPLTEERQEAENWYTLEEDGEGLDYFFVFAGNYMPLLTGNTIKSIQHRVIGNQTQMQKDRLSIAYAYRLNIFEPWVNFITGQMIEFEGKELSPGAWSHVLGKNPKATEEDLYLNLQQRWKGLKNLHSYVNTLESST
ncbi:MAG: hypothetical protein KTR14_02385 [Vampirovibrio sp.]|nr:hypothetical protein [Vampirovibrio sp.]